MLSINTEWIINRPKYEAKMEECKLMYRKVEQVCPIQTNKILIQRIIPIFKFYMLDNNNNQN